MDFQLTPEEEGFRDQVRAFLDEHLPVTDGNEWLRKVREKRWVGFSWPEEVGGGGGTHYHPRTPRRGSHRCSGSN